MMRCTIEHHPKAATAEAPLGHCRTSAREEISSHKEWALMPHCCRRMPFLSPVKETSPSSQLSR